MAKTCFGFGVPEGKAELVSFGSDLVEDDVDIAWLGCESMGDL